MTSLRVSLLKKPFVLGLGVLATALSCHCASAQSLSSFSRISAINTDISGFLTPLDEQDDIIGNPTSVTGTHTFKGMDHTGTMQTMTLMGQASASSSYGRLHSASAQTVTNTYYNAANPIYFNSNNNAVDPNGSPDVLATDSEASFTDILQYGGILQSGYQARYIFHVDGTNVGGGRTLVVLGVQIAMDATETFGSLDTGYLNTIWATGLHPVNGITPQAVHVDFGTLANVGTQDVADGSTVSNSSDFSSTLTLAGIELYDANGDLASGWTVTSASGTQYNTIQGSVVPEPGSMALLVGLASAGAGLLRKRRRN